MTFNLQSVLNAYNVPAPVSCDEPSELVSHSSEPVVDKRELVNNIINVSNSKIGKRKKLKSLLELHAELIDQFDTENDDFLDQ